MEFFDDFADPQINALFDQEKTMSSLCYAFVTNGKISISELNSAIIDHVKTSKDLLYQAQNKRMPSLHIAQAALINIANQCLSFDYPRKYSATLPHLQQWLAMHNTGWQCLKESIDYIDKL